MFQRSKTRYGVKAFRALFNGDLIKSCFKATEKFLIGDLRTFNLGAAIHEARLEQKASEGAVVLKKFGIYCNFAIVIPGCNKSYQIFDDCDKQPEGRMPYSNFNLIINGSFSFSKTGPESHKHQKLFKNFMKPELYTDVVEKITRLQLKQCVESKEGLDARHIRKIILNVLAEILLGLTEPLSKKELDILEKNSLKETLQDAFYPVFVRFVKLYKRRKEYGVFIDAFLTSRIPAIEEELKTHPDPIRSNLLVATLIEAIKKDYPQLTDDELNSLLKTISQRTIQDYLKKDSYIRGLFLSLVAAENLVRISYDLGLFCGFDFLTMPDAIKDDDIKDWGSEAKHYLSMTDIQENYCKSLASRREIDALSRYTSKRLSFFTSNTSSVSIPANTYFLFINPSQDYTNSYDEQGDECKRTEQKLNEFPYTPFSRGSRMCPASRGVAEEIYKTLYKTIVDYLVENHKDKMNFTWKKTCSF